ncbi:MAG: MBL fold metallo-hydrolase [Anaerolineae bacterium]|nr:MBL fold metallo-hydrolase [Anaerolineae bacterium]
MAVKTIRISKTFFDVCDDTRLTWLGMAGALINSRGTILIIDPLLTYGATPDLCETGHRLATPLPITSEDVPKADLVCYTHADFDHFAASTATILNRRLKPRFLAPAPVAKELRAIGVNEDRITVAKDFASVSCGDAEIIITPALHDWQEVDPWQREDCCGFLITTPDGVIWHPGDTRLIPELEDIRGVDVLFFDVAAVDAHLGPKGSARLAHTSGAKVMLAYHYGLFDMPPGSFGGCDPHDALPYIANLDADFLQPDLGEVLRLPLTGRETEQEAG